MTDEPTCTFGIYKEIVGADNQTNYALVNTLPPMNVEKVAMSHVLNKQVQPIPPDNGEEQPPLIVILGVKDKAINFSGTFQDYAYVLGQAPPIELIPRSGIIKLEDDPKGLCPEFDDDTGYWRIKSVGWSVDSKSMLWKADVQTSYIWTNPLESMFFE